MIWRYVFPITCLFMLLGCENPPSVATSSSTLIPKSIPKTEVDGKYWANPPVISRQGANRAASRVAAKAILSLHPFTDSSCLVPAPGTLVYDGPDELGEFHNVKYTNPANHMNETIHLKVTDDQTFICTDGIVILHPFALGSGFDLFTAISDVPANQKDEIGLSAIDSQDRTIVAVSHHNVAGSYELLVYRYLPDGTVDPDFGTNGYTIFQPGGNGASGAANAVKEDFPCSIQIDEQNRIDIVGTTVASNGAQELVLWRFNEDGSPDTSFGSGTGYVVFQKGGVSAAGSVGSLKRDLAASPGGLGIDSGGNIIVAGHSRNATGHWEATLWKFQEDGSLDPNFTDGSGSLGYAVFHHNDIGAAGASTSTKMDEVYGLVVDGNGKYVMTGQSQNSVGGHEIVLWRYLSNGSLDPSFGSSGVVLFQHDGTGLGGVANADKYDFPADISLDPDGNYAVGVSTSSPSHGNEIGVISVGNNGNILMAAVFNPGGLGAGGASNIIKSDWPGAFTVDSEGRYVFGQVNTPDRRWPLAMWRMKGDGTPDETIGSGNGFVLFGNGASLAGATDLEVDDGVWGKVSEDAFGRYVTTGWSHNAAGGYEAVTLRVLEDGTLDK